MILSGRKTKTEHGRTNRKQQGTSDVKNENTDPPNKKIVINGGINRAKKEEKLARKNRSVEIKKNITGEKNNPKGRAYTNNKIRPLKGTERKLKEEN